MENRALKVLCRIFRQKDNREGQISSVSILGILVNFVISLSKILVGIIASSIAIISEGINNAIDSLTSIITLIGTKLSNKHPDEKHPFGYGRIEYLTSLVIAVFIIVTGVETIIEAVKLIFNPKPLAVSYISIVIIGVTAVIKFFLGLFTMKTGKSVGSDALYGVGLDCRNDCFSSLITIVATLIFLIFGFSLDAYAGVIIAILVLYSGLRLLFETVGDLLGRKGEKELATEIYKEILSTPSVLSAADMMLHNYGPGRYSGSANLEVDHEKTIGEVYQTLHALQLKLMHEKGVTFVFGLYAVDRDHEDAKELRKYIENFVRVTEHIKGFHAVYLEPDTNDIYCDFIVDYSLRDWDEVRNKFINYMKEKYPNNRIELTIETEFV